MAAGDKVLSFGTLMIDTNGRCAIRVDPNVVDRDNQRHRLPSKTVAITPTGDLATQVAALRTAIESAIKAALPADLAGATVLPAASLQREDRLAAKATREAAREAARETARTRDATRSEERRSRQPR